ncbi:Abi family protein [Desulfitibacter alkalitolerans]|uniref:Abi family protein n=1 Tax=Desulfitibacter alkalitolerans TaxID=264641 RepID=UPI0004846B34|nr:Abi family protein [Desulfitibacter alkalitolerans]
MNKEKLTIDQIIAHMKDKKGIAFTIVDEIAAKDFLMHNNYYFKVKAYAKNYEKYLKGDMAGKYINLEFAYLLELSKIDMYFRRLIIKMALDIEHFLKTQLLRDVMDNDLEDGYSIIHEFLSMYPYVKNNIVDKIQHSACRDLILKYENNFAIWNIIEILSFGDFIKLYEMYYNKYRNRDSMNNHLWSVKFLRNAAAHNNCLLNSLRTPYTISININKNVNTFISKIPGIGSDSRKKKMKNPIIHDFVVTLYVFNRVVTSDNIKKHTMNELKDLIDNRFTANKEYFKCNQVIESYYHFMKKIVDYFYKL